jgi:4-diphosphocytidyl-2-C-methyl-D-erythritol kinase
MIVYPCAKINIGLKITGKRSDGYHDLETFFFPVELTDILEVVEAEETILYVYGKKPDCSMEDNLCYKAYQLLKRDFNLPPVEIHLFKRIPYGAGLGGGSSDGSNMLIVLNKLFNLGLTDHQLCKYASKLG